MTGPRGLDLERGRELLEAAREEADKVPSDQPYPRYVEWLVWARENAAAMLELLEEAASREEKDVTEWREAMREWRESMKEWRDSPPETSATSRK